MSKVIISADSTCDIGKDLSKKFNVELFDWRIELEGKEYVDNVGITPDDLYVAWRERKALPKSTAATPHEYQQHFKKLLESADEVVHVGLGSSLSSSFQNCCTAADEIGNVYVVDSNNLSTGFGQLVIQATKFADQGKSGAEIQTAVQAMTGRTHASFLLDTLEFMKAGGRCSSVAALGASMFKLKPCIEVDNTKGAEMHVGKKYQGKMEACLKRYVKDKLEDRDDIDLERLFISHSGSPTSDIELVRQEVEKYQKFENIEITRASCVISTHCGPRTLGLLFMTKE